jgi:transcriptional regulator with XRE-family HTH domain
MAARIPKPNRFDSATFYAALDTARALRGVSWRLIARETGVSASTLTRMADGLHCPDLDSVATLLAWLGMDFEMFVTSKNARLKAESIAGVATLLHSDPTLDRDAAALILGVLTKIYEAVRVNV